MSLSVKSLPSLSDLALRLRGRALKGTAVQDDQGFYLYGAPVGKFCVLLTSADQAAAKDYDLHIWDTRSHKTVLRLKARAGMICLEHVSKEAATLLGQALDKSRTGSDPSPWVDYCNARQTFFAG